MAGLTPEGLVIKTQPELEAEITGGIRTNVSPGIKATTDTVVGQAVKLTSERIADLWELLQAVYDSQDPSTATGISLARVAKITGTEKRPATKTRVTATVNIDPGTYPAGSLIAHIIGRPQERFVSIETAENLTASAGEVDIVFEAEIAGPIVVLAGQLGVIASPVTGWNWVYNADDGTTGLPEETDEQLRTRRENELDSAGSTTVEAIAADVRKVEGVISVRGLNNDFDATDANGLPPHSVEMIVFGPEIPVASDDTAVAEQIAASKADGVRAYGSTVVVVEDDEGNEQVIGFSRPTIVQVEYAVTVKIDPTSYAGDAAVKEALTSYTNALLSGQSVSYFNAACMALHVAGVQTIQALTLSRVGDPPGTVDLPMGTREIPRVSSLNITVTQVTA